MSITNYGELKTAVANWLLRSDLTSRIPEFIALAETRLMYGDLTPGFETPALRVGDMITSTTLTASTETTSLPSDFLEIMAIHVSQGGDDYPLSAMSSETQTRLYGSAGQDQPTSYEIDGGNLRLHPIPNASYSVPMRYYAKYAAFSADSDDNWVITNAPGAYLYAALTEAYLFTRNDAEAQKCAVRTKGIVEGLNRQARNRRFGGTKMSAVPGHSTP